MTEPASGGNFTVVTIATTETESCSKLNFNPVVPGPVLTIAELPFLVLTQNVRTDVNLR